MNGRFFYFFVIFACMFMDVFAKDIVVGTSSMYPPFEYVENGELKGFDIDLAKAVAKEIGVTVLFKDMQFSTLFISLKNQYIDMIIATVSPNHYRMENFDFSDPYYFGGISAVFRSSTNIKTKDDLIGKKVASQLGSTISYWARENISAVNLIEFNDSNGAVESVKAGHAQVALVDLLQGKQFANVNSGLSNLALVENSHEGYSIVLMKGSPMLAKVNEALDKIKSSGELEELKKKWLYEK